MGMGSTSATITQYSRRLRVFLCHCSDDKPKVHELYYRLKDEGFDPWLDEEKLIPGQTWQEETKAAMRASDVVVVCLSRTSITKEGFVQKEIRLALDVEEEKPERTIFIIPARLEPVTVPERLSSWQWVDLFQQDGFERLLRALGTRAAKIGLTSNLFSVKATQRTKRRRRLAKWPSAISLAIALGLMTLISWRYFLLREVKGTSGVNPGNPIVAPITPATNSESGTALPAVKYHPLVSNDKSFSERAGKIQEHLADLQLRATAMNDRWKPVVTKLQSMNQQLQPEIATALGRLTLYTHQAEEALKAGQTTQAMEDINLAEKQLEFLGRQQPE